MSTLLQTVDLQTNFYTYEGVVRALNRVSLVIDHGSTFGLVGDSRAGDAPFSETPSDHPRPAQGRDLRS